MGGASLWVTHGCLAPGHRGWGWFIQPPIRALSTTCPGSSVQDGHWPLFLSVVAIPAALQLLLLRWFPESPRYLLIEKNDVRSATQGEPGSPILACWTPTPPASRLPGAEGNPQAA